MFTKNWVWILLLIIVLIISVMWIRQKHLTSLNQNKTNIPVVSRVSDVTEGTSSDLILSQYSAVTEKTFGERMALVKAPTVWNKKVVIALHGKGQEVDVMFDGQSNQSSFTNEALRRGFLVIAPDSIEPICEGVKQWDHTNQSIDFPFFENIFSWTTNAWGAEKIYVVGMSSGGFMTERLALTYPQMIDAVVIHSGGSPENGPINKNETCKLDFNTNALSIPTTHPPTYILHGDSDRLVDYEIGLNLYTNLIKSGIETEMYTKKWGRHLWFSDHNVAILEWLNKW